MTINLFSPSMGQEEIDAVGEVIKSGWITLGPKVKQFEEEFSAFIKIPYSVGLSSCTDALELALKLTGVREGDEVLVPSLTFVSSAHAIVYNKATPIFCDINPQSLLVDFEDLKNKVTTRTKAIVAVHYGGRCVDVETLKALTNNLIPIIEDCAHACGSSINNSMAGSLGNYGCFSFHAVKNLATGDGGMLTTRKKEEMIRCKELRWLGINKGTWDRVDTYNKYLWEYNVDEIGHKCYMNDISAAIGIVQLKKLEIMNQKRKWVESFYRNELQTNENIVLPQEDTATSKSSWHLFPIRVSKEIRDRLIGEFAKQEINVGVHYKPIHLYPCYNQSVKLPYVENIWQELISLPIHPGLTEEDLLKVCRVLKEL